MTKEILGGTVGTGLSAVGTATQTNQILQTISLIITIVGALITYLIIPLIIWYKKAKSDGKITKKEINEGLDKLSNGVNKIKETINKKEEDKK